MLAVDLQREGEASQRVQHPGGHPGCEQHHPRVRPGEGANGGRFAEFRQNIQQLILVFVKAHPLRTVFKALAEGKIGSILPALQEMRNVAHHIQPLLADFQPDAQAFTGQK